MFNSTVTFHCLLVCVYRHGVQIIASYYDSIFSVTGNKQSEKRLLIAGAFVSTDARSCVILSAASKSKASAGLESRSGSLYE